jgi:hypothetical protein
MRTTGIARLLFGVTLPLSCATAVYTQPSPDLTLIDGEKNPELIPEYLMWSTALDAIALLAEQNVSEHGPLKALLSSISASDAELVLAEAAEHTKRADACHQKGLRIVEAMKGHGIDRLEKAMKANTLACREVLLDATDRLLARLSPEGRTALTAWVLEGRRKVKAWIVKTDLDFFRQPR